MARYLQSKGISRNLDFLNRKFGLLVNRQLPQVPVRLHSHQFSELVIVQTGKGTHFNRTDAYEVVAGDCFEVIGEHGYKDCEDLILTNILYMPERLSLPWDDARKLPGYHAFFALEPKYRKLHNFRSRLRFSPSDLSLVLGIIDKMEHELTEQKPGFEFITAALFMEMITLIARAYAGMEGKTYPSLLRLSEVMSHFERSYDKEIRMAELTKIACMSESRLIHAFKDATGFSPIDYLIRLRIRHACSLMQQENLSISEIGYRVGFNDSNYFSRQFRKIMGSGPREFRKKNPRF
jgi:AraC-like DNA-binding protein